MNSLFEKRSLIQQLPKRRGLLHTQAGHILSDQMAHCTVCYLYSTFLCQTSRSTTFIYVGEVLGTEPRLLYRLDKWLAIQMNPSPFSK